MSEQPNTHKAKLKAAQAKHQADLFGAEAAPDSKPTAQQAQAQQGARARDLGQAAQARKAKLSADEQAKLDELRRRSEAGRQAARQAPPAKAPSAQPAQAQSPRPARPAKPAQPGSDLHQLSQRSDLAASALQNMRQHMKAAPKQTPPPAQRKQAPRPDQPAPPRARPAKGIPPSPEELDKLLREMAQRAASRPPRPRPVGGMPGMPERPEAAPVVETPPPPPEVFEQEKANEEKSAEILQELQAKEQAVQQQVTPIPQADQERAIEEAVEAEVSLRTRGNAISSDELYQSIRHLRDAMRVHDAGGQVHGVNEVQRRIPGHPLSEEQN